MVPPPTASNEIQTTDTLRFTVAHTQRNRLFIPPDYLDYLDASPPPLPSPQLLIFSTVLFQISFSNSICYMLCLISVLSHGYRHCIHLLFHCYHTQSPISLPVVPNRSPKIDFNRSHLLSVAYRSTFPGKKHFWSRIGIRLFALAYAFLAFFSSLPYFTWKLFDFWSRTAINVFCYVSF